MPPTLKFLVWEKTGARKRKVPILSQVYWKMVLLLLNSNSGMGVLCWLLPCLFCAHIVSSLSQLSSLCSAFPLYAENPTRILSNIKSPVITIDTSGSDIKTKFLQSPSLVYICNVLGSHISSGPQQRNYFPKYCVGNGHFYINLF